ncbi:MAG: hypothetical protein QOE63_893, partial [Acidimicrobiaceae bacterium]
ALPIGGPSAADAAAAPHDPIASTGLAPTTPWAMAETLLYLAGPHSTHITGAVLNADRGASAA